MTDQANKTAGLTYDITYADLAGANSGQRPDLLTDDQDVYRTPDGKLYSVSNGQLVQAQNLVATFATDPLTGGVSLIGPTGASVGFPSQYGVNTISIGDSISGQAYTQNGASGDGLAYNSGIQSETRAKGFLSWLQVLSGNALIPSYNGGISGQRTDQILARVPAMLSTYAPQWAIELSGTNDISQLATTYAGNAITCENTIYQNRISMWSLCLASGASVIALAIPPCRTTGAAYSATQMGILNRANRRLKDYCTTSKIYWVDVYSKLVDVTNPNGYGLDTYFDTTTLHPAPSGAYVMAKEIYSKISGLLPNYTGLISGLSDSYAFDSTSKQIFTGTDSLMQSGTNTTAQTGTTGTYPNASGSNLWLLSRTAGTGTGAVTTQANPDGIGNSVKMVITAAAAGDAFRMLWVDAAPSLAKIPAGSSVYFECAVKITGMTNLGGLNASILVTTTGGASAGAYVSYALQTSNVVTENGVTDATGFTGVVRSQVINIPSDTTGISLLRAGLQPYFMGAGGATVEMWRPTIVHT